MSHTPTPWKLEQNKRDICATANGNEFVAQVNVGFGRERQTANAEFIVKAVNSYEADRKAMNDAMDALRDGQAMLATSIITEALGYEPRSEN